MWKLASDIFNRLFSRSPERSDRRLDFDVVAGKWEKLVDRLETRLAKTESRLVLCEAECAKCRQDHLNAKVGLANLKLELAVLMEQIEKINKK